MTFHKRTAKLSLAVLIFCLFSFLPAQAADEVPIIEEGYAQETETGFLDKFREYVFLDFAGFITPSGQNRRNLLVGSGGFDFSTDNFQAFFAGRAWREEIRFKQEITSKGRRDREDAGRIHESMRTDEQMRIANLSDTNTVKFKTDGIEVDEAFVSYSPIPQLNVKAGRRKVVWGQFSTFSPVFFTLPFRTQNRGTTFSKANFAIPQDNVQVSIIPHERIELQGYFFLRTRLAPLIVDITRRDNPGVSRKSLQDHNQYAARALFYPSWGTIALTYYNGRNTFFAEEQETLSPECSVAMSHTDCERVKNPDLVKLEAYGIEASIPAGKWNVKGEFVYRESVGGLGSLDPAREVDRDGDGRVRVENNNAGRFFNWVLNSNNRRFYGKQTGLFGGVGIEYATDKWFAEISGFLFKDDFSGSAKEGARLAEAFTGNDPLVGLVVAPFINSLYFITKDKKNFVGGTAGFIGTFAVGGSLYAVTTIDRFDETGLGTFQLTAGLDFVQYRSDELISEFIDPDEHYDVDNNFTVAPRVGLIWKF